MHRPAKRGIGSAQRRLVGTRRQEVFVLFTSSTFVCRYLTLTRQNACNLVGNKYLWSFMESRSKSAWKPSSLKGGIDQTNKKPASPRVSKSIRFSDECAFLSSCAADEGSTQSHSQGIWHWHPKCWWLTALHLVCFVMILSHELLAFRLTFVFSHHSNRLALMTN